METSPQKAPGGPGELLMLSTVSARAPTAAVTSEGHKPPPGGLVVVPGLPGK